MTGGLSPYRVVNRGEIYWVNFDDTDEEEPRSAPTGSETKGWHPAVIISNDVGNVFAPVVVVASITSKAAKRKQTWDVELAAGQPLPEAGRIQGNQIVTISKDRLGTRRLGALSPMQLPALDYAIRVSLGLDGTTPAKP